jgi:Uma2 family endonuclease
MPAELRRRRFTADEYHWMARVGILGPNDRVELLDGAIIEMPPISPEHAATVNGFNEHFLSRFGDVAQVRVRNPIRIDTFGEPQPDVVLVRRRADSYRLAHPAPEDAFLVVEVADTSLADDRRVKLPFYARAGIAEAWLVDLQHGVVHVHREPSPDGYRVIRTVRRGERLAPLAFPDREIAVADLLG